MTKKKLIEPWHDGLIEPGTLWKEQIVQSLETMEVFLGLLTTEFLASDFIETVELEAAHAKRKKQGNDFLFILIMVDDISLVALERLSQYQILKPGGKAICQHKSRKEGFNVAQKDLEKLILKLQDEKRRSGPKLHDKTSY